jgi:hypothetical protein
MTTFTLGQSIWGQSERDYHSKLKKHVDWGLIKQAPYSNTLHSADWYQPTNWNNKPIESRINILVKARVGQSMMGRYMNPPFSPFPTMANYTDRMFKKKMDAIQGAGQFLDIPWTDYTGVTHTITFKETKK